MQISEMPGVDSRMESTSSETPTTPEHSGHGSVPAAALTRHRALVDGAEPTQPLLPLGRHRGPPDTARQMPGMRLGRLMLALLLLLNAAGLGGAWAYRTVQYAHVLSADVTRHLKTVEAVLSSA